MLACLDRVVTTGTLPAIADDGAMVGLLGYSGMRVFEDTQWVEPLRGAGIAFTMALGAAAHSKRKTNRPQAPGQTHHSIMRYC